MWAGWRLEADIGVTSEPFVSSFKVVGRGTPESLNWEPPSIYSLFPVSSWEAGIAWSFREGGFWGVSELEWVTLHCVYDHIAHAGNESFWLFYTGFALFFFSHQDDSVWEDKGHVLEEVSTLGCQGVSPWAD